MVVANGCFDSVFNESNFVTSHVILNIDPNEFALDAERENAFKLVDFNKTNKNNKMSGVLGASVPASSPILFHIQELLVPANLPPGLKSQGLKILSLRPSRGLSLRARRISVLARKTAFIN